MRAFDWNGIRSLYEGGRTAYELGKLPGNPSKQAILKRAKREGWRAGNAVAEPATKAPGRAVAFNGDAQKGIVLTHLRDGMPFRYAALAAGVTDRTVRNWRDNDSSFSEACQTAIAQFTAEQLANIRDAGKRDWKASMALLERHPDTREDFAPARSSGSPGLEIVLNINRDGPSPTTVEGTATPIDAPRSLPVLEMPESTPSTPRHDPLGRQ
jgi:hypothetical protein